MPLDEIRQRLKELPADKDIVAYCRGPFCMMSAEAVALLREHGYRAQKIADGIPEWQAAGLNGSAENDWRAERARQLVQRNTLEREAASHRADSAALTVPPSPAPPAVHRRRRPLPLTILTRRLRLSSKRLVQVAPARPASHYSSLKWEGKVSRLLKWLQNWRYLKTRYMRGQIPKARNTTKTLQRL